MRLRLILRSLAPERVEIPINYNGIVSRYIYDLLDPDEPFSGSVEGIPYYTFSNLYIPNVEQRGCKLSFENTDVQITLSLLIGPEFEEAVIARLMRNEQLCFPDEVSLAVTQIDVLEECTEFDREMSFRMNSPLASPLAVALGPAEDYLRYHTHDFADALREILLARLFRLQGGVPADQEFDLILDQSYIQRKRGKISKLITIEDGDEAVRRVKAIIAPFTCVGNPELIRLGYVAGFGEKNVLGFGCAEVAGVIPKVERSVRVKASAPHLSRARTHAPQISAKHT